MSTTASGVVFLRRTHGKCSPVPVHRNPRRMSAQAWHMRAAICRSGNGSRKTREYVGMYGREGTRAACALRVRRIRPRGVWPSSRVRRDTRPRVRCAMPSSAASFPVLLFAYSQQFRIASLLQRAALNGHGACTAYGREGRPQERRPRAYVKSPASEPACRRLVRSSYSGYMNFASGCCVRSRSISTSCARTIPCCASQRSSQ